MWSAFNYRNNGTVRSCLSCPDREGGSPSLSLYQEAALTKSDMNFNYADLLFFPHTLSRTACCEEGKQTRADTKVMFPSSISVHFLCALYKIDFIIRAKTFWSGQKYFSSESRKIKFRHFGVLWKVNCFARILLLDGKLTSHGSYLLAVHSGNLSFKGIHSIQWHTLILSWDGLSFLYLCIYCFLFVCFVGGVCVELCVYYFNGLF